jgi:hypothetical protein
VIHFHCNRYDILQPLDPQKENVDIRLRECPSETPAELTAGSSTQLKLDLLQAVVILV